MHHFAHQYCLAYRILKNACTFAARISRKAKNNKLKWQNNKYYIALFADAVEMK
jgi:hypothetical protein